MANVTDTMIKVVATTENALKQVNVDNNSNGSVYFTSDNQALYYDFNNQRTQITDVIIVETAEEQTQMQNNPIEGKFYYVKESNELYFRGNDNVWNNVFPAEINEYDCGYF